MAEPTETMNANQQQNQIDLSRQRQQAKFRYDKAIESGDVRGQQIALLDMLRIEFDAGTFEKDIEFGNIVRNITPTLWKNLQDLRATLIKDGAEKTLELMLERQKSQKDLLAKESSDLFDLIKGGFKPGINLLGTFKSFALVLQAFGIDTTEFVQNCDDMIYAEQKKMPEINYKRMNDLDTVIRTGATEGRATGSMKTAIDELSNPDTAEKLSRAMVRGGNAPFTGLVKEAGSGNTPHPAPTASPVSQFIETKKVLDAIVQQGVVDAAKIQAMVDNVKDIEGNPNTLSQNELKKLEQKLSGNLNDPAKAHQVMTKAQEMALEPH
ncbi:MAG TPA: hypothetical protein PKH37_08400 [Alphaproteobacteria bacterium]|nr:hypothetical protein [Alphaproteobacteria bacterium]